MVTTKKKSCFSLLLGVQQASVGTMVDEWDYGRRMVNGDK